MAATRNRRKARRVSVERKFAVAQMMDEWAYGKQ